MPQPIDILIARKAEEVYAIVYTPETADEALRTLARWACDKELGFNWEMAAILGQRVRRQMEGAAT